MKFIKMVNNDKKFLNRFPMTVCESIYQNIDKLGTVRTIRENYHLISKYDLTQSEYIRLIAMLALQIRKYERLKKKG